MTVVLSAYLTTSATMSLGSRRKRCETQTFIQKCCISIQNIRFANHPRKCTAMVMAMVAEGGVTEEEEKREMVEEAGGVVEEGMEEGGEVVGERTGEEEEERIGEVGGKRGKELVG